MGFFGASKHSSSWTPGSFPGSMQVMAPGYSYSSSAVWQAQPVMAYPSHPMVVQVPVPVHVQVPVPYPVHVPTPMGYSSPSLAPGATYTVVQSTSPNTNTLHLQTAPSQVPSPVITHVIPPPPAAAPPSQPPLALNHSYVVHHQQQPQHHQQQQVQAQVFSVPQQQQQHQQGQSPINIYIGTPLQGQTQLQGGDTPWSAPAEMQPQQTPPAVTVTDDDDASSEDNSDSQHDHTHDPDIRKPTPTPSPNTPRRPVSGINISFTSAHPVLSALVLPTSLPQLHLF